MQSATLAVFCVFMTLGMTMALYGGGGYASPYGGSGGGGLMLLCFLFFFLILFNGNLFNKTTSTTAINPNITILQG